MFRVWLIYNSIARCNCWIRVMVRNRKTPVSFLNRYSCYFTMTEITHRTKYIRQLLKANITIHTFEEEHHVKYHHLMVLFKDVFGSFLFIFSIDLFYIYIRCMKFNTEFNKLIKQQVTVLFFPEKWCWSHPPLPTIITLFGQFHIVTYQVLKLKQNTKEARYVSSVYV